MRLRAELVPDFDPQVRTAVVSADPMKVFEIKATKATAPNRLFKLFGSNAAALKWMMTEAPGNSDAPLALVVRAKPDGGDSPRTLALLQALARSPEREHAPG